MLTATSPVNLQATATVPPSRSRCDDVLRDIEDRLAALVATGHGSRIDLSECELSAAEYRRLHLALAPPQAAVAATLPGGWQLHETAYAGVWWVTRFEAREDFAGHVIEVAFATEVIEIGHLPAILGRTARDVARGLRRLRARRYRCGRAVSAVGGEARRG